jgi:hypothetical protein
VIVLKKFILGLLCGVILTGSPIVYASNTVQAYLFPVNYFFNGDNKELSNEYSTLNYNGHAYVPVRFITENIGGTVKYDDESGTILVNHPTVVQYNRADLGSPSIEGFITKVENDRILVVSSNPIDFSASGGDKEFYDAVWVSNVPKDVYVGQSVQVWYQSVLQSYPGQAISDKISFKPSVRPLNSTFSEDQVIQQLINKQEFDDINIFVIKEIKYEESTDSWLIRFKEGMTDSVQDKEDIIQITD